MRYFIKLSYKGTNYHGWQSQPNALSVQQTLEEVLTIILKQKIQIMGAGRTDTGVHAKQMYAHFDYNNTIDSSFLTHKLNAFLPNDIAIFDVFLVDDLAHARFDATKRTYQYHIHSKKNAFECDGSWFYKNDLDVNLMNKACLLLFDFTNFECFSKTNTDVNTFNCKITHAFWQQNNSNLIFTITADRFLRNMVRAIVGTLINVGLEKVSLQQFKEIIISKNRQRAGFSVPAHGLYLTKIDYLYLNENQSI